MEYLNLTNSKYIEIAKRPEIFPQIKIEILDNHDTAIEEITQDLFTTSSGSLSANYQQGVWRSCSLNIIDINKKYLKSLYNNSFWMNRKFKLYLGLKDIFTNDIYWFSQGVYYVINPSIDRSSETIAISGVDKFGIFGSETGYNQLDGTYVIKSGTKAYAAIRDILLLDMGNGYLIDTLEPILDNVYIKETLPYNINKAPKSYIGEILIEIANVLGCNIFYDTEGRLNLTSGILDVSYSNEASIWQFSQNYSEYLKNSSLNLNTTEIYNIVKIVGANINDKIHEYTAINNNSLSNTNVSLIGSKMYYEESATVYNIDRAKDYAQLVLRQKSIAQQAFSFECSLLPHLQPNKVIDISDDHFNFDKTRFIIQSISVNLDFSGKMNISTSNIAELPYYEHRNG